MLYCLYCGCDELIGSRKDLNDDMVSLADSCMFHSAFLYARLIFEFHPYFKCCDCFSALGSRPIFKTLQITQARCTATQSCRRCSYCFSCSWYVFSLTSMPLLVHLLLRLYLLYSFLLKRFTHFLICFLKTLILTIFFL